MTFLLPMWAIVAIVCLLLYVVIKRSSGVGDWRRVMSSSVLEFLTGSADKGRRLPALLVSAIGFMALTNPSMPSSDAESFRQSQGVLVLIDLSRSMTLDDIVPTRLSAARDIALDIQKRSGGSPVSLIGFAGEAYLITPPAFDATAYRSAVLLMEYGLIDTDGSNLTRALSLASSVLTNSQMISSRVVVLTDTGGINAKSQSAAVHLASNGHVVDVVAIGSSRTSANAPYDIDSAAKLTSAGNGTLVQVDSLGQVDIDSLMSAGFKSHTALIQTGISVLQWSNLSHWLLLLTIPLLLLMFRQEFRA